MGLFDWLSGSDEAEQAAEANRAQLAQYGVQSADQYNQYRTGALGALGEARSGALGALGTGLEGTLGAFRSGLGTLQGTTTAPLQGALSTLQGTSPQALQDAISAQVAGLGAVQGGGAGALDAGRAGVAAYAPLSRLGESYQPAIDAYLSSLGIGDPSRARNAFTASPGYEFQQKEAADRAIAQASRLGLAGSGNTEDALTRLASGLANQEYGNWQNRLGGFVAPQLQAVSGAATGVAGANRTLADIYRQGGADVAGAYGNVAGAYGNLFGGQRGLGQDVAGAYGNLFTGQRGVGQDVAGAYGNIAGAYDTDAARRAGIYTGGGQDITNVLGNVAAGRTQSLRDITQGNLSANQMVAQAGQQDAANLWGLLGAGTKAVGSYFGGRA